MEEDKTTVTISVRKQDETAFLKLLGRKPDHRDDFLDPFLIELMFDECDHPGCEKFHFEGIPFIGFHNHGYYYDPHRMCGDGHTCRECPADRDECLYILVDEETGLPDWKSSDAVRAFLEFEGECREQMKPARKTIPAA